MTRTWLHDPAEETACTVIAEVAQAHDGSLGMAHAFVDAAARAGADAVKFQTHIAAAESSAAEPWRTKFSRQDETRPDYWRRMEFTPEQWDGLRQHAVNAGLLFLSSPFSPEAVDLLERIGVAGWKIASGEIASPAMLDRMAAGGLPLMLSTGMSTLDEIDGAVERLRAHGQPLAVLQCTSMYPCPPERVGLNVIGEFRERYGCAVGLSDHSATIWPGIAAAARGIEVLEIHFTLSREMFGPDVVASVTSDELASLVQGVRFVETMRASPVDKTVLPEGAAELRDIFMKSAVAVRDLAAGHILGAGDLAARKPGTGIPAAEMPALAGRRLARPVAAGALLAPEDLEAGE